MNKIGFKLASIVALTAILFGCSTPTPKETLEKALANSIEMKSYGFATTAKLSVEFPNGAPKDGKEAIFASALKDAELKLSGVYQKDPQQIEMTVDVALKGDMGITLSIPIIVTKDKAWVKIPSIPFIPVPEAVVGKYYEVNIADLNKSAGLKGDAPKIDDIRDFVVQVLGVAIESLDSKGFIKEPAKKDTVIPDSADAKHIFKIAVTDENFEPMAKMFVEDTAPKVLDVIAKPKWLDLFNMKKEDIDSAKKDLEETKKTLSKDIADIKKSVKIHEVSLTTAIDKKGNLTHADYLVDVTTLDPESVHIKLQVAFDISNVNETPVFKLGIPKSTDVVTEEQITK